MPDRPQPARVRRPPTGIARGSLGTGTAVDDDTQLYRAREITWRPSAPDEAVASGRAAASAPEPTPESAPAPAPIAPIAAGAAHGDGSPFEGTRSLEVPDVAHGEAEASSLEAAPLSRTVRRTRGRAAGRTLSVALAVILVALVGVAVFGSIGQPAGADSKPGAAESIAGQQGEGQGGGNGNAREGGAGKGDRGGNGNGNGNGQGHGNGRGSDED